MKFKDELLILFRLTRAYKWAFINLFLCVIVTSFVWMLYPYIFGMLVDEVFYRQNKEFFLRIVSAYILIYLSEQGLHLILNSVWSYLMTRFLFDIRKKIFEKIYKLKSVWFSHSQTGDIVTLINKDAEEFMNLIHWNIFYGFANLLRLVLVVVLVCILNFKMALLMLVLVPLSVYTSMFFGKYIKRRLELYRTEYGKLTSWVLEILNGLRDVQLLASQKIVSQKFIRSVARLIPLKVQVRQFELSSSRVIAGISMCSNLVLYSVSAYLIINDEFTVGAFIAVIEYFSRANSILENLSGASTRLQQNQVSIRRILDLWNEEEESKLGQAAQIRNGSIRFENVSFYYTPEAEIIRNFSLDILGNEKIALVGASGAGKSTLIQLLLKFYEPTAGSIQIDGIDIKDYSIRSLRKSIGVVLQESLIFDGTLRSNLRIAKQNATDHEIETALKNANLGEFFATLPHGLNTALGQGGRSFSGGQKQRLAIARVFVKNPRILILDEATSALDSESEHMIYQVLDEVCKNRTTIIIAHRLSSILRANKVAFLHNGEIRALGTHEELLTRCPEYAQVIHHQYISKGESDERII